MPKPKTCVHGATPQCRDCRLESWRHANRQRQQRGLAGTICSRCGKLRTTDDGNHAGYCRECLRWWYLEYTFGITQAQYEAMLTAQGNGCAICGRPPEGSYPGKLHVDHDHATGRIRGLLCQVCNLSLGKFKHDPDLLRRAAAYLEESRVSSVGAPVVPAGRAGAG